MIAFVRLAQSADLLHQARIDTQQADAMIVADLVVGASNEALQSAARGRTRVAVNLRAIPTSAFVADPDADLHESALLAKIEHAIGSHSIGACNAQALSEQLLGDTLTANVLLLGFAWQQGLVPVGRAALERALELNGVAVAANQLAFACGRLAAAEPAKLDALLGVRLAAPEPSASDQLDAITQRARAHLADYQNAAYALRYQNFVDQVRSAERALVAADAPLELTRQVALNYAKLLAHKDEFEVARLYTNGSLERSLDEQFSGHYAVHYHFAPEYLAKERLDGRPVVKRSLGPRAHLGLKLLAGLRGLRGTALDPFGWSPTRRDERALAGQYARMIEQLLPDLNASNLATAVQIAALPKRVRGFGHVRKMATAAMQDQAAALRESLAAASARAVSAAENSAL